MGKRLRNFIVMRYIVNRTPALIALCVAFFLANCGGEDSPTAPTQDINGARIQVTDVTVGPLAGAGGQCLKGCRSLLQASLSVSAVQNDDAGNARLIKRDAANNTGRDDVCAAWLPAAGALARAPDRSRRSHIVCR